MKPPEPALEIAVVWSDADLQEVVIAAVSRAFSGRVNLYASPNELLEVADAINELSYQSR